MLDLVTMPNPNRSRVEVTLGTDWRNYTNTLPANCEALGSVRQGQYEGALVRLSDDKYARVNAGLVYELDGRKVSSALGTQGRPPLPGEPRRVNVYLDQNTIETLTRLGHGNLSQGIRLAAAAASVADKILGVSE